MIKKILLTVILGPIILAIAACLGVYMYVTQPFAGSGEPSNVTVDIERMEKHVRIMSEDFHKRNFLNRDNLAKCVEFIRGNFEAAGAQVEIQPFQVAAQEIEAWEVTIPAQTFENVSAIFGKGKGRKLIIGAHYDSFNETPGADDNASGVAGLIELAYLLQKYPPDREIELVAYCLEEPPFFATDEMGSYAHAKHVKETHSELPVGVIVLEMIGYFTDEPDSQDYPAPFMDKMYPNKGNFIAVVGNMDQRDFVGRVKGCMKGTTSLPIESLIGPRSITGIDFSDHRNYWPFGINAVMITDTSFYRNKEYHQVGETADRLDFHRMGDVVVMVYESTRTL